MDLLVKELMQVLDQEMKIYDDILKISQNKTNIVVEGKVSDLESIVKTEQSLVLHMAKMENQRETIINKISKLINIKPEDLTITNLIKHIKKDQGERLKSQQEDLSKVLKELRDVNEINSKLIKNSLDFINFSMNLMANVGTQDNNYSGDGEKAGGKAKNFFDLKI